MKLIERFKQGKFVITCELGPPKGIEIDKLIDELEPLRNKVDAFNVTDLQSSVMRVGSLAACRLLKDKDLEPIMQLTCRDRNRLGLQSDVLSAAVLGIENLLCLTGDHPTLGDHPKAMPVFDLDSVQLLSAVKGLMGGKPEESLDLPVNFPEDYPHEDLANKKALFKITVHTIQEPKLLPLDDTLAKKVGVEAGFEGLKTKVRERMELELKHWLESKVKEDVLDKLIALNAISIPNALLDKEIENLQKMAESYINSANQGGVSNTPPRELFTERAEKQVMVGLLFSEIIKTCDMKVDRAKVQEKIVELAAGYQEPEKMVDMMSKNERWRSDAEATVLEEQVISKLMDDANVVVKSVSYNDIMNTEENEDKE